MNLPHLRRVSVAAGAALCLFAVAACGDDGDGGGDASPTPEETSESPGETPENPPEDDVTIESCEADPSTSLPAAELDITNHSSKSSNYVVHVEFLDSSGDRVEETLAASNNVAPDQTSRVTAQGLTAAPAELTCNITEVVRTAAE